MKKVLVTGAAGVLGKALVPLLEQDADIELRLTDIRPVDTPHEFRQADLSTWDDVSRLCEGIEEVVHIAAIHPWKPYFAQQYLDCNIKGTYNILQAAVDAGVRRVVYTSSIAAMGYRPDRPGQVVFDESKACRPAEDVYGISKHVGEQFCEMFHRRSGLSYIALRPGTFVPRDGRDASFGLGLLTQWLHAGDVAAAHRLALRSTVENEAIIITAKVPFVPADAAALLADAPGVIARYFPDAARLAERGVELPSTIDRCYSIAKAERLLGFRPRLNFGEWLEGFLAS